MPTQCQPITCPDCGKVINFKRCRNCIEFHRHYAKIKDNADRYMELEVGHCARRRVDVIKADDYCRNWNGK